MKLDPEVDRHREEIEALLAGIDRSSPAILRSLDAALETATSIIAVLDSMSEASSRPSAG